MRIVSLLIHGCFAISFYFLNIFLMTASTQVIADSFEPTFSWEEACAVSVCRGTGHDGAFSAKFSPNGELLLVEVKSLDKDGLYLVDTKGETSLLTKGRAVNWHPTGKEVIYLDEDGLWSIDINTLNKTKLTNMIEGSQSLKLSPNGKWLAFAKQQAEHKDIWVMPLDGSKPAKKLTNKAMSADEIRFNFSWSPDSKFISYFSNKTDYWFDELWMVEVASQNQTKLTDTVMGRSAPSWSPDSSKIAIYGTQKSDYWYTQLADIFVVDLQTKHYKKLDMQVRANEEAGSLKWSANSMQLYFINHRRGEHELWSVDSDGGVATRVTHSGGLIHAWDMSTSSDAFAIIRSLPTRGRELELVSGKGGTPSQLTQFSTNWTGLVEPKQISYKAKDGTYIQAFAFYPPSFNANKSYPAIVQVHGGGTHSYYNGLNLVEQRLAQLGYVVLAVNYRGGSGFGRDFQDLATNDWANTQALDAASAADFIRAQPWSNKKVGIYGYSYGGIISMGAITRSPNAFDAAVPMSGIYDFASAYNNQNRLIRLFIKHGHSGTPDETPEHYRISNSLDKISAVNTPVLLMHGESDTIAPFNQFEMARDALIKHDKEFDAYSFSNQPHRFTNKQNRVEMYQKLEAWMDRWLKE
ncbi:MAG: prolyl oligopeptidase family serine peptidase [Paraglaciecola sp.]|uniref:prolyl oligopeptidase family serine peptidase n=1 Tax=Paraglaciecola sp. TaxID=1920173 RepID=UPI003298ADF6